VSDDLIFREVDEDIRRERMQAIWKRYGGIALGIAILVVAIVAGTVLWRDYAAAERQEQGAQFEAALALALDGQPGEAAAAFDRLAAEGDDGYRLLAQIQAAAARAEAGAGAEALSAYDRILEQGTDSELIGDLVRLKAALLALDIEGGEAALSRLGGLAEGDGPFRNAAREVRASALLASGDRDGAIAELRAIASDATATPTQQQRVSQVLRALGG
jgi:hypothetical protein